MITSQHTHRVRYNNDNPETMIVLQEDRTSQLKVGKLVVYKKTYNLEQTCDVNSNSTKVVGFKN